MEYFFMKVLLIAAAKLAFFTASISNHPLPADPGGDPDGVAVIRTITK